MKSLSSQPSGAQQQPRPFLEPAIHNAVYGRHKFLSFASQPGPQKKKQLRVSARKVCPFAGQAFDATAEVAGQPRFPSFASCAQQTFADTIWEEGLSNQAPQVAVERIRQRQSRLESGLLHSCPSCPAFFEEGRIYSSRNILRGLHFLGLQLFQLLWGPRQVQISAWGVNLLSDGSLEESGTWEIRVMMEQLSDLSGQLSALEEQSESWHKKELFLYSMLASAWLFNIWLWLRR